MKVRALAIVAVALAGAVGTTFAEAHDRSDVHFSVAIGPAWSGKSASAWPTRSQKNTGAVRAGEAGEMLG